MLMEHSVDSSVLHLRDQSKITLRLKGLETINQIKKTAKIPWQERVAVNNLKFCVT